MDSSAEREASTHGEAAVNEWTPVSCSARKFQSGYNGAAHASEGSDSIQLPLCYNSLSIIHNSAEAMCATTAQEETVRRREPDTLIKAKMTGIKCALLFFSTHVCFFLLSA